MNENVSRLIKAIEDYKFQRITGDGLELATSRILAADDYEVMTPEFRQHIELLDMWDVNALTPEDLEVAEAYFSRWLTEQR